jgi:hypothetical protein
LQAARQRSVPTAQGLLWAEGSMTGWRPRELLTSAGMAALGMLWLSSAWTAVDWAPAYNIALRVACALACFAVVADPAVLYERRGFARLFGDSDARSLAFSLLAALGIVAAVLALALWLSKPLWSR